MVAGVVLAACLASLAVVSRAGGPGEDVAIASARSFDPEGDGTEKEELTANAIDGDPETAWRSEAYDDPVALAGNKDGFGLVADLDRTADVSTVSIDTPEGGWSARVYASDAPGEDRASWGEPLASVTEADAGTTTFAVDAPGVAHVMVWFTRAAPSGVVSVSDMRVSGT